MRMEGQTDRQCLVLGVNFEQLYVKNTFKVASFAWYILPFPKDPIGFNITCPPRSPCCDLMFLPVLAIAENL